MRINLWYNEGLIAFDVNVVTKKRKDEVQVKKIGKNLVN